MTSEIQEQPANYNLADIKPVLKKASGSNTLLDSLPIWLSAQTTKSAGRGRSAENTHQYGVQKLRELILELAVRGKLVPQSPDDEPASELLKKVEENRNDLSKAGVIKKPKAIPQLSEDEKWFTPPTSWAFARLGNLLDRISNGFGGKQNKSKQGVPVTRIETISKGVIDLEKLGYSDLIPKDKLNYYKLKPGDILLSHINSDYHLGKTAIFSGNEEIYHGVNLLLLRVNSHLNPEYVNLIINNLRQKGYFLEIAQHAIGQASINQGKINAILAAIPPLAEQHRIVKKVDELMALCDKLEHQQADAVQAHDILVKVLLDTLTQSDNADDFQQNWRRIAEHFDTLFTTESSIDQLKQTLLQLAVMGKLVPQDPSDEPASVLLEKIAEEKAGLVKEGIIKKTKPFKPNEKSLIRNIPSGWTNGFMPLVVETDKYAIKRGPFGSALKKAYFVNSGYKVYEQQHAIKDDFSLGKYYINEEKFRELRAFEVRPGDLIISCSGTVGRVAEAPENMQPGVINQALLKISLNQKALINDYFKILFAAFFMQTETLSELQGTAQKNMVSVDTLKNEPFPLPPLAEQHRIVKKVDELMALCDQLKSRLNQAQKLQKQLAEAVVEHGVKS